MLYYLVLALMFLAALFLPLALFVWLNGARLRTLSRLEAYNDPQPAAVAPIRGSERISLRENLLSALGLFGKLLPKGHGYLAKRKRKLMQAAILMKPEEFLGVCVFLATAFAVTVYLLSRNVLIAAVGLPLGFLLPELLVGGRKKQRKAKLNAQLPEALGIIANGIRAGFSFNQAIATVNRELSSPITDEFAKVLRENALGKNMEDALRNLTERTEDEDLDMFVTALVIQMQVGGNLAEILDTISHTIRERVRIKGEINTLTAQGKVSAVIVILMPLGVAAGLAMVNPGYLDELLTNPIGMLMLGTGILMQAIGIFLLTKIIDIKV